MRLNIIHLPQRLDRLRILQQELDSQNIKDFKIWDGIIDQDIPHVGISRAHKQIVKYAKVEGLSEILIAEDDLCFTSKGAFEFFLENKPLEFDIYLASIYYGNLKQDNSVDDFAGATFYIISQKFYDIFLSIPEYQNFDRSLRNKGRFIVCNPFTVIQHNGYSDNTKEYSNYHQYLVNRKLF